MHEGLQTIAAHLGAVVDLSPAPQELIARFQAAHKTIYDFEISQNLHPIIDLQPDKISAHAKDAVWRGRQLSSCLLYTSPSPRDRQKSRMPSSA